MSVLRRPANRPLAVRFVGGLLLAAGLVTGAHAAFGYAARRSQWAEESARLSAADPSYDADSSDRLYEAMLRHRVTAERAGGLTGLAAVLLSLTWRPRGRFATGRAPSVRRSHAATLVDAVMLCALLALASQIELWLSPGQAGWGGFLGRLALGVTLALGWGGMAAGVTIGGRLTGTRIARAGAAPGIGLGLAALLLAPLAWPHSALAFVLPGRRGPLHLAWAGLESTLAEPAHTAAFPSAQI